MTLDQAFPASCLDYLVGEGSTLTLGLDLGTTENKMSNPTALALTEALPGQVQKHLRLAARFKTGQRAILQGVLERLIHLVEKRGSRLRCLELDGTNERLTATDLAQDLAGHVVVRIALLGTTRLVYGEKVTLKTYLGSLVKSHLEDNRLTLPAAEWIKKDFRQPVTDRGTWKSDVASDGSHADLFVAMGLSLDAFDQDGHVEATAVPLSSYTSSPRPTNPTEEDENEDASWIARTLARLGF
jgi:hypothetical protein